MAFVGATMSQRSGALKGLTVDTLGTARQFDKIQGDKRFAPLYNAFKIALHEHPNPWVLNVQSSQGALVLQALVSKNEACFQTRIEPQGDDYVKSLQGHIATIEAQTLAVAQAAKQQRQPSLFGSLRQWASAALGV